MGRWVVGNLVTALSPKLNFLILDLTYDWELDLDLRLWT